MASNIFDKQNLLYLYDLPKDEFTSIKLAEAFKNNANVTLDNPPQIKRDYARPFYSGIVSINDPNMFKEACEKMKYFEIDGKQCRALQFDKDLLGAHKIKLSSQNVFVRKLPKDMKHKDLETKFAAHGGIKSLKISLNADHSSRGYGFVCFKEEEGATNALKATGEADEVQAVKFEPKDRREVRKLINNVYVKNIPLEWSDEKVKALFAPYGEIKSLVLNKNDMGQFGFVCFDDPKGQSKEYGPMCANKAIENLQGKDMGKDPTGREMKLYVRPAMKKSDRFVEKIKETIKYKNSKKRCNLYVKNFPANWTQENLTDLFKQCGEIENIRLDKGKTGNAYAFICYKQPDAAATAKQTLSNQTYGDKVLIINHYEIKELRKIQLEEAKDKADFQQYKTKQTGGFQWNDLTSQPHLTQIIQQLLALIQQNEAMNEQMNQAGRHQMHHMSRGGGPQRRMGQNNYHQQRQQNQYQGGNNMQQQMQQMPGQPMPGQPVPPRGMPQAPQQPAMAQPGMPQAPPMPSVQAPMPNAQQQVPVNQNMPIAQRYQLAASKLLPSVVEKNPYLKDHVGHLIYDYVQSLIGSEKAPKITGMLIELPVQQIRQYMSNFDALNLKVSEANQLLMQQEQQ